MANFIGKGIFFLLVLWTGVLHGQDRPELAVTIIDTALLRNAEAVIRNEETRYIIKSPREFTHLVTKTVTIFNEESNQVYAGVAYDKYSSGELISVMVYDAYGHFMRKIKKSEIRDFAVPSEGTLFSDQRVSGIKTFGGQLPYTIEYRSELNHHETIFFDDWQPQGENVSIEKATFILDAPLDLPFHTRSFNFDFIYAIEKNETRNIQSWTIKQSKAIEYEESGPPDNELFPLVVISPSAFEVDGYTGSMSDWKSFGTFLYEINKDREKMTPAMSVLIKQMTSNCHTPFEKIDTLYHWLQKNMRYVSVQLGIGGWQSFDAAYVEKNKFGDCKALSTFMKGMLREVGIESYQVVIKWDEEESLFPDDLMYNDFNHMMLHVPSENMWLECTSNHLPTGFIDKDEENKKVILITPEGGIISRTPSLPDSLNTITTIDTIIGINQAAISGRETYFGNQQRGVRSLYYYASQEEQRKYFLEHFHLPIQKLDRFHISTEKSGFSSSLSYHATLSKFGSISGNRIFMPVNSVQPPHNTCPGNTDRKTDFISRDDYTETNDIYISMPAEYTIEYLPPETNFDFNGNRYSVTLRLENGFIHIHHQIVETPMRLTPVEYKEMCSYYASVSKANSQMIVLKKSKA